MPPQLAKLAGLGALGAVGFFVALFALIAYASIPRTTGGIDRTTAAVTWISIGVVVLLVGAFHVVIARRLFDLGRGIRSEP